METEVNTPIENWLKFLGLLFLLMALGHLSKLPPRAHQTNSHPEAESFSSKTVSAYTNEELQPQTTHSERSSP